MPENAALMELDAELMGRALELGRSGDPSPNPHVGAVIAAGREIVGEGFHNLAGDEHAEIVALKAAGERARGATLYVTLEPCNHTGRTGPCVDALLAAGARRVVYAIDDLNPVAAGGAARLCEAGVEVEAGVLADEVARGPLEAWLHSTSTGRPFVTWKY